MTRFNQSEAVVIKRTNYSDTDRFVTLFTQNFGKVSARARGIRKLKSRKRSALEPLNHVKVHLIQTHGGFLISEAILIESFPRIKSTLPRLTQAVQMVEIVDSLIAEEETHPTVYTQFLQTLHSLNTDSMNRQQIVDTVKFVLEELGFGFPDDSESHLKDHIESITQRRLKTKQFLTLPKY